MRKHIAVMMLVADIGRTTEMRMTSRAKVDKVLERHLDKVRTKFDETLDQRLSDVVALMSVLVGTGPDAAQAVQAVYKTVHPICGIAGMIGYPLIGTSARKLDNALVASFRAGRGLSEDDIDIVKAALLDLSSAVNARRHSTA